jgi:hypothetical protein
VVAIKILFKFRPLNQIENRQSFIPEAVMISKGDIVA